jgi:gliding motility-associated-like protein
MHWGDVKHMPTLKTDDNPAHYLVVYGGVTFNDKMILDLDRPLYFRANTLGNVINFGGKVFDGDIYFENDGGWRITTPIDIKGNDIYYKQGTLSVEADLSCGSIISENAVSRELFLNSSKITLSKGGASVLKFQTDNLTVHPDASEIIIDSNNSKIEFEGTKGIDFNNILFKGDDGLLDNKAFLCSISELKFEKNGSLSGANDFEELVFTEGNTYTILGGGQKITKRFLAMGKCYAYITIKANTIVNVDAELVEFDYLKVQNIHAGGTAANFAAPNSFNLGGNNNWDFTLPPGNDITWSGAAGDNKWSNYKNWIGDCVPSRRNNVIIPAGKTVEVDAPAECKSLTVDNSSNFTGNGTLEIFGSLTAGTANWTYLGETWFKGNDANNISIGIAMQGMVYIDGDGTWTLQENIEIDNKFELLSGTFNANNKNITVDQFVSNSTLNRTLDIQNSEMKIEKGVSKAWHVEGTSFNLSYLGSKIIFLESSAEMYNNVAGGIIYDEVHFNSLDGQVFLTNEGVEPVFTQFQFNGSAKISGNHQFHSLTFSAGKEYLFNAGSEQKMLKKDGLVASGTCADIISLKGDGGIAYFDCDVTTNAIQYVRIEDLNVKGGVATVGLPASNSVGVKGYEGWKIGGPASGTDITWTGNVDDDWFNAGNWDGGCIPTRVDNVKFDEGALTGAKIATVRISKIGSIAEFLDMKWETSANLKFTGDQPMNCFGSMDLSGIASLNCTFSGTVNFKAETAATVNFGGVKLIGDLNFTGNEQEDGSLIAEKWTLAGDIATEGKINLKKGAIISANYNIEAKEFFSNYSEEYIRALELGSSTVKLEKMEVSSEAFTLDAGTSTIEFLEGGELTLSAGVKAIEPIKFHDVHFSNADKTANLKVFADDVSFNNMTFKGNTFFRQTNVSKIGFVAESIEMSVGKSYVFESTQTYEVGNIIANGACEGTIDITASRSDAAILKKKTGAATITVNKVNLLNIHADPTNEFVAKASLDLGNNDGWKFEDEPAGQDLYWIGGTGNWDDPNHWAKTSGSLIADGCVPTAKDNVFFDDGSFTATGQTVYTGSSDIRCRTMNWTGSESARPNFEMGSTDISGVYIYGSLILNSTVEVNLSPLVDFYFRANDAQEINAFGYDFPKNVEFDGKGGQWTLKDSLKVEGDLYIRYGKLVSDGKYVECKSLNSDDEPEGVASRGLDISNSKVVVNGSEDLSGKSVHIKLTDAYLDLGFELISDNSTVIFPNNASILVVGVKGQPSVFNEVIFEEDGEINSGNFPNKPLYKKVHFKGNGKILGENQFGDLELGRGNDFEFQYHSSRVYEMDNLIVNGSCFAPISIHSSSDGKQFTIKAANNVTGNFLQLKDIKGDTSGGISYTATNSFDQGNVEGWDIDGAIAPIALYWTGKGADDSWHNHENWSRAEDGSEEGCVPTLNDDVFFTEKSFLGSKLVEITEAAQCHNITWEDDVDPAANFLVDYELKVGGSLDFTTNMSISMNGTFYFVGDGKTGDKTVDFADKTMDGDVKFQGDDQSWIWASKLITSGDLYIESGSVVTDGNDFTVGRFSSLSLDDASAVRKFDMSGSLVHVTSDEKTGWNMKMNTAGGLDFTATDTKITFDNGGGIYCETDAEVTFGFIDFLKNGVINISSKSNSEKANFGSVAFMEQGQIFGKCSFSNLEFTLGYENNTIEAGKTVTVINDLKMEGVRCSYIFLKSSKKGEKAYLNKPTGTWNKIYNASFEDIVASTGSGIDHPVYYHYEELGLTSGFVKKTDTSGGDMPPSFTETFTEAKEEYCSVVATLDHVKYFPINSKTEFQWYQSTDGGTTYDLLPGETNAVITVDESAFYKVEVIYGKNTVADDGSLCKIESVIEVILGAVSTVSLEITANNVKCFGEGNGRIIAKVKENPSGNYPDYAFFWKDEDGNDITSTTSTNKIDWISTGINLTPGKYSISVTDSKGCDFDTIVSVYDAYKLLIDDIDTKDLTCYTKPEGEILVHASGGTGDLSYYLDDELKPGKNITGLFSGDYAVYVKDANECKTDDEAVILNSNPKIEVNLNAEDLSCFGDANGKFTPVVSGGVPTYTYSWSGPSGFSSTDLNITDLNGGEYQLTITDNVSCVADTIYTLKEPEQLTTKELVVEPTNCNGESSGEIFVVGDKGTPDYKYYLNGAENVEGKFYNLEAKTHELKIVDANGCIFLKDVEVEQPQPIGFIVEDKVMPSCDKKFDGVIHVKPFGGNEGYTFSWTGPNDYRSYSEDIENLESGEYRLLVTDKKNCSNEDVVDLDLGLTLQLGLVVEQHVTKPGLSDGSLALELIEGTTPYTFTITGPAGTINSPDNFDDHNFLVENLPSGVYKVVATDASNCVTVEKSIIIEEPGRLYAYIEEILPVGCPGSTDGELRAIAKGGDGSYTYSWTGPKNGSNKSHFGLGAGTYNLTVSSAGQTANANYTLVDASPVIVSIAAFKNVSCLSEANGEITLDVDAGGVDYEIEWTSDNGYLSSATHIMDLKPGIYNYKVTTKYGCTAVGSQEITEPTGLDLNLTQKDISKVGERDGTVTANFSGGTPPYTVLISGPNGYSHAENNNTSGTITVDKLEQGNYEVAVLDANECRIDDIIKVHEPEKLLLSVSAKTNVTCPGGNDGAIEIAVEGASDMANVTFEWVGDNFFRSIDQNINNLKAGKYTIKVNDSKGDPGYESQTMIVMVTESDPLEIDFWKKDITCPGDNDGYINIHPQGGTPNYTCLWTGSGVNVSDEDQSNLAPGTYTVKITDSNGCTMDKDTVIVISEPAELNVSVAGQKDPTCYGFENGWIKLDITNGTAPYRISWDNYGSVTQNILDLEKGVYQYIVTDDNGCSKSSIVTLNQPDSLIALINDFDDVLCHGDGSGRAYVEITGGTPAYSILWSDGQDTQEATDLKLGKYEVKIEDAQGCTDTSSVEIFEPEPLAMKVEAIRPTTYEANDGELNVQITGGVTDYSIDWVDQDLNAFSGDKLTDLERGTYELTVTDQNRCEIDSTIVLEYLFEERIKIPKAFTPNADGYNDYWDLERIEFVQNLKIVIYDRWGKTVYKFSGTGNEYKGTPWTGADGTKKLPVGSYYYAVEVDDEKPQMGTVTILR